MHSKEIYSVCIYSILCLITQYLKTFGLFLLSISNCCFSFVVFSFLACFVILCVRVIWHLGWRYLPSEKIHIYFGRLVRLPLVLDHFKYKIMTRTNQGIYSCKIPLISVASGSGFTFTHWVLRVRFLQMSDFNCEKIHFSVSEVPSLLNQSWKRCSWGFGRAGSKASVHSTVELVLM